ncbi:5-methyltetrahydrofolate--homocysteine methyltransferase [Methanophagales archaeon]|nr:5-methyltetrahydrofolate--homocysteine methyltransferase [Methanophagales archaeon]
MGDTIVDTLLDVKKKKIEIFCEEKLNNGMSAYAILDELGEGLREIGRGYKEIYFDAELMVSGWNAKKALQILKPLLQEEVKVEEKIGKVVIGTVKGDVHDIGKEIVTIMLASDGFEVIDLGTDVEKEAYAKSVQEAGADIIAMSALLTTTREYMAEVIQYFREEELEVKIMVGGSAVSEEYAMEIGADAYGKDAVDAVKKAKALIQNHCL